jgi:FHS family Na+ dependent glucose MFS transporter 1
LETTLNTSNLKRNQSIGYFIAFIMLGMGMAVLGPSLPTLAKNTGSSIAQISILFTASSAGYFVGSVFGGRFYDRFSGHPIMGILLGFIALGFVLIPFVPLLWLLAANLFLLGVFQGVLDVGGNTLLIWVHRQEVGPYMNALHFFFGVGTFISPIILAQAVLRSGDIKIGYLVIALLILPVLLFIVRQPSPKAPSEAEEIADKGQQDSRTRAILIFFTAAILFFYVGAEIGLGGWIYTYALEANLANETTAAYLTSVFWGAFTMGRLISIPLATRFRPRTLMLTDFIGCLLGMGLILLLPRSLVALWGGTALVGFSMASVFPTTISLAERRMPISGQTTSLFFIGVSLGSMLIPWLMGQLIEPMGPQAALYVVLIALILDLAVFLGLLRYSQKIDIAPA